MLFGSRDRKGKDSIGSVFPENTKAQIDKLIWSQFICIFQHHIFLCIYLINGRDKKKEIFQDFCKGLKKENFAHLFLGTGAKAHKTLLMTRLLHTNSKMYSKTKQGNVLAPGLLWESFRHLLINILFNYYL